VAEKAGFERVGTLDDYRPSRAIDPEARYRVNRWILHGDPRNSG
jgi:RimJ/RimL family protein N-acetyltransferase